MSVRLAIGIGCSTRATPEEIVELVRRALNGEPPPGTIVATVDRRRVVVGAAARVFEAPLVVFRAEELLRVDGVTSRSARARDVLGTWSVAEASALAAAGDGARLLVARRTGAHCTFALAEARS